jgi:hypothetical protein
MIRTLAIMAVVIMAAGCAPSTPPAPAAKASEIGRYVIVHSPEAEQDTILLDTVTGRTWSRVEVTDVVDEPPAWDPMPQLNSPQDIEALRAVHGSKPKSGHSNSN